VRDLEAAHVESAAGSRTVRVDASDPRVRVVSGFVLPVAQ
jgi:hypothetical protein